MPPRTAAQKIKQILKLGCLGSVTFAGICIYQGNEKFYRSFLMPFLQNWVVKDAEKAHRFAIWAAKNNLLVAPKSVRIQRRNNDFNCAQISSQFVRKIIPQTY